VRVRIPADLSAGTRTPSLARLAGFAHLGDLLDTGPAGGTMFAPAGSLVAESDR
jgi:hypothetical protein